MKTLLLWRHAKARPADPGQEDAERPLAEQGEWAAAAMARAREASIARVGLALCSPALRARQTLGAADGGLAGIPHRFEPGLYLASREDLIERATRIEEDHTSALIVGHNPGLEQLVQLLQRDGDGTSLARFAEGFKAGALAEMELDVPLWREVRAGCATLKAFTRPRDLDEPPR